MNKVVLLLIVCGVLITGCGRKSISSIVDTPVLQFPAQTVHHEMTVYGRLASHDEVSKWFNRFDDLYHYYHIVQIRAVNTGYVRYTLYAEECSFFIPSLEILRPYTSYHTNGGGLFLGFLNAVVLFPVYAISMLKSAVETPPYLTYPDLVIPRSFGWLTGLYVGAILLPVFIGMLWERSRSTYAFREAESYFLTQNQKITCEPFGTVDCMILTPRAGFTVPCCLGVYNHKTHEMEKVALSLHPQYA
jgi:hypothetical protein